MEKDIHRQSVEVNKLISEEAQQLTNRDRRYFAVVAPMRIWTLLSSEKGQQLESAYYFARHIDDVLDGDRVTPDGTDPESYVHQILDSLDGKSVGGDPAITALYRRALVYESVTSVAGDDFERDIRHLIDAMLFDHHRTKSWQETGQPTILSGDELDDYYHETFGTSLNITLASTGSGLRSKDLDDFICALGKMYSVHDLEEDLARGILNIPSEILANVEANLTDLASIADSRIVREWAKEELVANEAVLFAVNRRLKYTTDRKGRFVCGLLSLGPMRYRKKMMNTESGPWTRA